MKKITQEEFEQYNYNLGSRGMNNPITQEIKNMEVGEHLFVSKEEWKMKTTPSVYFGNYKVRGIFTASVKTIPEGWVITKKK